MQAALQKEDLLRKTAPSIWAESPDEKVSDKYSFIPTYKILSMFENQGWVVDRATEVKTRDNRLTSKHKVHLYHQDHINNFNDTFRVGDTRPELILVNSHDWSSSLQSWAGLFRKICSNGMVVSDADFGGFRLIHQDINEETVMEATMRLSTIAMDLGAKVGTWRNIILEPEQKLILSKGAAIIRWEDPDPAPELCNALLRSRRDADRGNDLWTTFNVVQENVIKGGFAHPVTGRKVRAIKGIGKDMDVNHQLWELGDAFLPPVSMN